MMEKSGVDMLTGYASLSLFSLLGQSLTMPASRNNCLEQTAASMDLSSWNSWTWDKTMNPIGQLSRG
jgi:hypothetical protein